MWLLAVTAVVVAGFTVPTTVVVIIAVIALGLAAAHSELIRHLGGKEKRPQRCCLTSMCTEAHYPNHH